MTTGLRAHLYDQFRRPRGPAGRLAGRIMARRTSSVERSRWTVGILGLSPGARVLELGYGPGLGIGAAVDATPDGHVVGIDHSSTMRAMAARRNRHALRAGHATLLVGDAEHPPADIGTFDAIFCCNVWLFWADPDATIAGLARLLEPSGALAITHLPRHGTPTPGDTHDAADRIEGQMARAGFGDLERSHLPLEPVPAVCLVGRLAANAVPTTALSAISC